MIVMGPLGTACETFGAGVPCLHYWRSEELAASLSQSRSADASDFDSDLALVFASLTLLRADSSSLLRSIPALFAIFMAVSVRECEDALTLFSTPD